MVYERKPYFLAIDAEDNVVGLPSDTMPTMPRGGQVIRAYVADNNAFWDFRNGPPPEHWWTNLESQSQPWLGEEYAPGDGRYPFPDEDPI